MVVVVTWATENYSGDGSVKWQRERRKREVVGGGQLRSWTHYDRDLMDFEVVSG